MMDTKKIRVVLLIGLVIMVAISGCRPKEDPLAEEARQTNVAQTVAVQFTKTAIARPTDTPVPTATTAPTATATLTTVVPTAALGTTPSPQATTTTAAPTASGGIDAGVWTRSAPADDSEILAGAKFQVVVTLMNTGTTTWTTDYYIQFVDGNNFGITQNTFKMPTEVPPTMSIQFTMNFTAPQTVGVAKSNWNIVNASNVPFGYFYFQYNIK
ncbi:MAG TPA: hypothetical protein DD636_06360 [Anaerolineaceae bacterium]|jgi:hypothetical protein|nr:hypothetical protein [Anaerolineaceae bacterium]